MSPTSLIESSHSDQLAAAEPELARLQRESARGEEHVACVAPVQARAVRGSLWTIGGYGASQVIRLAGNIVVSRLVLPEAFGLMALVNIFIQGLMMFSDVGIEPALVQNRRGDEPRFYNTAWTVQVARGWLLFAAACALAWPAALLYDEPRLCFLLPVAAATAVIGGFNSTALYAVRRHMVLGRLTILEVGSQVLCVVTMCLWATYVSADAWAMIAGLATLSLATLVVSHRLLPGYRNRYAWDRAAFAELVRFGKWVFVSTMITFCALQVDRLLLGRLISKDMLGVYSVALAVALLPNMLLQALSGAVLLPLLSEAARGGNGRLQASLTSARHVLMSLGLFLVAGIVFEAQTFFQVLYDDRYAAAGRVAQLLGLGTWVMILSTTLERLPIAAGETRSLAVYNFVKLAAVATCAPAGFYFAGLEGFIVGYAAGIGVGHVVLTMLVERHGVSVWRDDLCSAAGAGLVILLGLALLDFIAGRTFGPLPTWLVREAAAWAMLATLGVRALGKVRGLRK